MKDAGAPSDEKRRVSTPQKLARAGAPPPRGGGTVRKKPQGFLAECGIKDAGKNTPVACFSGCGSRAVPTTGAHTFYPEAEPGKEYLFGGIREGVAVSIAKRRLTPRRAHPTVVLLLEVNLLFYERGKQTGKGAYCR